MFRDRVIAVSSCKRGARHHRYTKHTAGGNAMSDVRRGRLTSCCTLLITLLSLSSLAMGQSNVFTGSQIPTFTGTSRGIHR